MYFNSILLYLIFVFMFICCVKPHRSNPSSHYNESYMILPSSIHIRSVDNHTPYSDYDLPPLHYSSRRNSRTSCSLLSKSNIHDTDSWSASVYLYRHRRIYDGIDRCYYKLHIPTQTGKYHNDGIRVLESTTSRTLRCTCYRR